MKKVILSSAALMSLLVSFSVSALSVEARGFALCTAGIDPATGICSAGAFFSGRPNPDYHPDGTLEQEGVFPPDWGTTNAERWKPHGVTSITGSTGVNWTCCIDYNPATENPAYITTTFEVWALPPGSGSYTWINATWKQYIGVDGDTYHWCYSHDDYVFQGRQDLYTPSSYTTNMRIARCKATYTYPPVGPYWHGIEYWMD